MQKKGTDRVRWVLRLKQLKGVIQVICACVLVLMLVAPAAAAKKRTTAKKKPLAGPKTHTFSTEIEKEMTKYLGIRYRTGGSTTSGVDCSGFVGLVYRNLYGVQLPHQSASLYQLSRLPRVSMAELKAGDLLFFTSSSKSKRISHVGIYLSEGKFIHAAQGKGVVISALEDCYWSVRVAGAKRVPVTDKSPPLDSETGEVYASALSPDTLSGSYAFHQGERGGTEILGQSLGLEFGLMRPLEENGGDLLRLSLFQESFLGWGRTETLGSPSPAGDASWQWERTSLASVQGVRLGSDIRPFEWLVLSPSLSYFHYEEGMDDSGLPRSALGIDVTLRSMEAAGWVLSTGLRYSSLIPDRGIPEESDPSNALDVSLTLTQRLSDKLSVSLMGERLQRLGALPSSDLSREELGWDDRRFSLMLSFSY